MNFYLKQIAELIDVIADVVVARRWNSIEDVDAFVDSWVTLGRIESSEDQKNSDRAVALTHALLIFGMGAAEDDEETWDNFLSSTDRECRNRDLYADIKGVRTVIFSSIQKLIYEPTQDNVNELMVCWDFAVWEDADYCNEMDNEAISVVIATIARLLGSVLKSMSTETRHFFATELHELSSELLEVEEDSAAVMQIDEREDTRTSSKEVDTGANLNDVLAIPKWRPTNSFKKNSKNKPSSNQELNEINANWRQTFAAILKKRSDANEVNKRNQCKPYFSGTGADYLAEAVARVLHMKPIPRGVTPKVWATQHPEDVVVLDSSLVLSHQNPRTKRIPVSAVKGRLKSMLNYFSKVEEVGAIGDLRYFGRGFDGKPVETGAAVILFRRN
jgi:hypothetical protein